MQIIKNVFNFLIFVLPLSGTAQTTYFQQGSKEYHFIDRMEIMAQSNTNLNFSSDKPYNRKFASQAFALLDSLGQFSKLSFSDQYNLQSLYKNNKE